MYLTTTCRYVGKLFAPQESTPSKMVVRFPLSKHSLILSYSKVLRSWIVLMSFVVNMNIPLVQTWSVRQATWWWTLTTTPTGWSAPARYRTPALSQVPQPYTARYVRVILPGTLAISWQVIQPYHLPGTSTLFLPGYSALSCQVPQFNVQVTRPYATR